MGSRVRVPSGPPTKRKASEKSEAFFMPGAERGDRNLICRFTLKKEEQTKSFAPLLNWYNLNRLTG